MRVVGRRWMWTVAGVVAIAGASITGISRILAGQHFPSDVLVGAAIGALTGWVVPAVHRQDVDDAGAQPLRVSIPLFTLPIGLQSRNR